MSDNIPFEIQLEIIKKVPDVKSLVRFRSVSKSWKSFIDSPEFIAAYGARDTQPHRLLLRYTDVVRTYKFKYISCIDDVTFPQQQQDVAPNVSDLVKQLKFSNVIGSSCGLWCLYGYKKHLTKMLVIWNPSIRKSVGIVVPCVFNNNLDRFTYFGFGVCPSTNDPTIVGMSFQKIATHNMTWQVGVFTLSSKTWKMIPSSNLPRGSIRLGSYTNVAIDRFIFWVANDTIAANDRVSRSTILILSFDLITHDFKEIHLPNSLANQSSPIMLISKLGESIVVSTYINEVEEIGYCLWMMGQEGGVMKSFTKLFTIKRPDSSIRRILLGFRKSGEPIMETLKEDEQFAALEVYEPCSEHINNLGIYGERGSFFICPYTESLLLIDHSDGCIISNDC